jgi:hypothetical protein
MFATVKTTLRNLHDQPGLDQSNIERWEKKKVPVNTKSNPSSGYPNWHQTHGSPQTVTKWCPERGAPVQHPRTIFIGALYVKQTVVSMTSQHITVTTVDFIMLFKGTPITVAVRSKA